MDPLNIICVDNEKESLDLLVQKLEIFQPFLSIERCESADECAELLDKLDGKGERVALIISCHIMSGKLGVELLTDVQNDLRFVKTKKILLTGHATHVELVTAINQAKINHFLEKNGNEAELVQCVKEQLTKYIIDKGIDHLDYNEVIDAPTLYRLTKI